MNNAGGNSDSEDDGNNGSHNEGDGNNGGGGNDTDGNNGGGNDSGGNEGDGNKNGGGNDTDGNNGGGNDSGGNDGNKNGGGNEGNGGNDPPEKKGYGDTKLDDEEEAGDEKEADVDEEANSDADGDRNDTKSDGEGDNGAKGDGDGTPKDEENEVNVDEEANSDADGDRNDTKSDGEGDNGAKGDGDGPPKDDKEEADDEAQRLQRLEMLKKQAFGADGSGSLFDNSKVLRIGKNPSSHESNGSSSTDSSEDQENLYQLEKKDLNEYGEEEFEIERVVKFSNISRKRVFVKWSGFGNNELTRKFLKSLSDELQYLWNSFTSENEDENILTKTNVWCDDKFFNVQQLEKPTFLDLQENYGLLYENDSSMGVIFTSRFFDPSVGKNIIADTSFRNMVLKVDIDGTPFAQLYKNLASWVPPMIPKDTFDTCLKVVTLYNLFAKHDNSTVKNYLIEGLGDTFDPECLAGSILFVILKGSVILRQTNINAGKCVTMDLNFRSLSSDFFFVCDVSDKSTIVDERFSMVNNRRDMDATVLKFVFIKSKNSNEMYAPTYLDSGTVEVANDAGKSKAPTKNLRLKSSQNVNGFTFKQPLHASAQRIMECFVEESEICSHQPDVVFDKEIKFGKNSSQRWIAFVIGRFKSSQFNEAECYFEKDDETRFMYMTTIVKLHPPSTAWNKNLRASDLDWEHYLTLGDVLSLGSENSVVLFGGVLLQRNYAAGSGSETKFFLLGIYRYKGSTRDKRNLDGVYPVLASQVLGNNHSVPFRLEEADYRDELSDVDINKIKERFAQDLAYIFGENTQLDLKRKTNQQVQSNFLKNTRRHVTRMNAAMRSKSKQATIKQRKVAPKTPAAPKTKAASAKKTSGGATGKNKRKPRAASSSSATPPLSKRRRIASSDHAGDGDGDGGGSSSDDDLVGSSTQRSGDFSDASFESGVGVATTSTERNLRSMFKHGVSDKDLLDYRNKRMLIYKNEMQSLSGAVKYGLDSINESLNKTAGQFLQFMNRPQPSVNVNPQISLSPGTMLVTSEDLQKLYANARESARNEYLQALKTQTDGFTGSIGSIIQAQERRYAQSRIEDRDFLVQQREKLQNEYAVYGLSQIQNTRMAAFITAQQSLLDLAEATGKTRLAGELRSLSDASNTYVSRVDPLVRFSPQQQQGHQQQLTNYNTLHSGNFSTFQATNSPSVQSTASDPSFSPTSFTLNSAQSSSSIGSSASIAMSSNIQPSSFILNSAQSSSSIGSSASIATTTSVQNSTEEQQQGKEELASLLAQQKELQNRIEGIQKKTHQ